MVAFAYAENLCRESDSFSNVARLFFAAFIRVPCAAAQAPPAVSIYTGLLHTPAAAQAAATPAAAHSLSTPQPMLLQSEDLVPG
jgi:hypothetical protein